MSFLNIFCVTVNFIQNSRVWCCIKPLEAFWKNTLQNLLFHSVQMEPGKWVYLLLKRIRARTGQIMQKLSNVLWLLNRWLKYEGLNFPIVLSPLENEHFSFQINGTSFLRNVVGVHTLNASTFLALARSEGEWFLVTSSFKSVIRSLGS